MTDGQILAQCAPDERGDPPVFWVVDFEGEVTVKRKSGSGWMEACRRSWLWSGDTLRIHDSASIVLVDGDGLERAHRHGGGAEAREITIETPEQERPSFLNRLWASLRSFYSEPIPEAPGAPRGFDESGFEEQEPPVLLYPRDGEMAPTRLRAAWLAPEDDAGPWMLCLRKGGGESMDDCPADRIFEVEAARADIESRPWLGIESFTVHLWGFPGPPLPPGEGYRLAVRRLDGEKYEYWGLWSVAANASERIATLREEAWRRFPPAGPDDVAARLFHAGELIEEELFTAALEVLLEARERQPKSPWVAHLLAWLYKEVGPPCLIAGSARDGR